MTLTLAAHASERSDIDKFINDTLARFPETPGLSVAVMKDGKPFLAAGYGYADLATKRPMTATTPVYVGSSTKSYTGLLMAILAQKGVVDLDTPVVKYLPELNAWEDSHRITLRMLLTHSAGIANDPIVTRTAFTGEHTTAQLLALLPSSKPIARGVYHYDNLGYVVSALIAERVTGTKWQDLLAQYVFRPLKMDHTSALMSATKPWGGLAVGYVTNRQRVNEPTTLPKRDNTMHAAGGIVTNAQDLTRWLEANVNDGRLAGKQIVTAAAVQETHKKQITYPDDTYYKFKRNAYGFGWNWSDYDGNLLMHHFGGYEGWRAHVSYMPERKIGVAVITNTSGLGSELTMLVATYIYDRLIQKDGFDPAYSERSAEMRKSIEERWSRVTAEYERRSKRAWSLPHALDAYTGRYESAGYGTLTIRHEGDKLLARLGPLSAPLEPFTKPETARVELIPNSGSVLAFTFDEGAAHPKTLAWDDTPFVRSGD
jgi:CubicO group peptidase (beta-lactamase class C family)